MLSSKSFKKKLIINWYSVISREIITKTLIITLLTIITSFNNSELSFFSFIFTEIIGKRRLEREAKIGFILLIIKIPNEYFAIVSFSENIVRIRKITFKNVTCMDLIINAMEV
jgi:hypothetical protein